MVNQKDFGILNLNSGGFESFPAEEEMRIRKENFQLAKDEIETLMDYLSEEMKKIDEARVGPYTTPQRNQKMIESEHTLAKSTLRETTKRVSIPFLSLESL